ncbi:MAG TPA: transposase [Candidatus Binataceae bacterium]|jgi:transposase-like protein|nr:transposase [Candidatus Binataceae bacterium]
MAKRFTEAQKQAALADLKDGMTLEQTAKKHKCSTASLMQWKKPSGSSTRTASKTKASRRTRSKTVTASATPSTHTERMMELEDENRHLKDENQSLRSLMLDGYISKERHPKLRQIAQTLRDAGRNQLQRILEIILVVEAERTGGGESLERPESAGSEATNGLPRHSAGTIRLRRKADQNP